jgi:hypothetical protein
MDLMSSPTKLETTDFFFKKNYSVEGKGSCYIIRNRNGVHTFGNVRLPVLSCKRALLLQYLLSQAAAAAKASSLVEIVVDW